MSDDTYPCAQLQPFNTTWDTDLLWLTHIFTKLNDSASITFFFSSLGLDTLCPISSKIYYILISLIILKER